MWVNVQVGRAGRERTLTRTVSIGAPQHWKASPEPTIAIFSAIQERPKIR